ncbi:DUF7333 family protein [Halococcoides cellulosivorans]|uniref:Cox cluster protein n=1 Tax=Halococcoides cellulosivorans TaxID=1679096 RepID=A0A2R4X0Z6_9EURY|nr:hypothetical protein [Halococcoides cellulosivorans]AWB27469.1 hypothetical protein HARCEL1_06990 [Halococcoides cellulosivorans]
MELDLLPAAGALAAVIAVSVGALIALPWMSASTVAMMVLPSMVIYGAIAFVIGTSYGQSRAGA